MELPLALNIGMGIVGTRFIAVVGQTNRCLVVAIWLFVGLVPDDVILPIDAGPNWNLHLGHTRWGKNIGNNHIEVAKGIVNLLNRNIGLDPLLCDGNRCLGLTQADCTSILLFQIEVNLIGPRAVFVVAGLNCYLIGPVGLGLCHIPGNIILAILL